MCTTCGCNSNGHKLSVFKSGQLTPTNLEGIQFRSPEAPTGKTIIDLEHDILDHNNQKAAENRAFFQARNILAINLVSSPGSGKTSILEKTLSDNRDGLSFYVVEGDQQTARDAERIAATGAAVVQINTGKGCHLDADMVASALNQMRPVENSVVMIENVGNLVCPAMFDLGESFRVVVISITEGEDKPLKYPDMFRSAQLCLINKIDLLPYLQFDLEQLKSYALQVNPDLAFLEISASTGAGMHEWYDWLLAEQAEVFNIRFAI